MPCCNLVLLAILTPQAPQAQMLTMKMLIVVKCGSDSKLLTFSTKVAACTEAKWTVRTAVKKIETGQQSDITIRKAY